MDTKLEKIKKFNQEQVDKNKVIADKGTKQFLEDAADKKDETRTDEEIVKEKAEEGTKPLTEKQKEQQKKEEEAKAAKDRADTLQHITDATSNLIDRTNAALDPVKNKIASLPVYGGIGLMLAFIAFMALAVVPVDSQGHTRLYFIWQTVLGRTHMKYRDTTQIGGTANSTYSGASTDFGTAQQSYTSSNGATPPSINLNGIDLFNL